MHLKSGVFFSSILTALFAAGCNAQSSVEKPSKAETAAKTDDHDHDHADDHKHDADHEHAETYAAALTKISELNDEIAAAAKKGELKSADGAVHDAGHLLEELSALANKEAFSEEQKDTVKAKADDLMEVFGEIDSQIHGGDGKNYDEVSDRISDALAALKSIAPATEK